MSKGETLYLMVSSIFLTVSLFALKELKDISNLTGLLILELRKKKNERRSK